MGNLCWELSEFAIILLYTGTFYFFFLIGSQYRFQAVLMNCSLDLQQESYQPSNIKGNAYANDQHHIQENGDRSGVNLNLSFWMFLIIFCYQFSYFTLYYKNFVIGDFRRHLVLLDIQKPLQLKNQIQKLKKLLWQTKMRKK